MYMSVRKEEDFNWPSVSQVGQPAVRLPWIDLPPADHAAAAGAQAAAPVPCANTHGWQTWPPMGRRPNGYGVTVRAPLPTYLPAGVRRGGCSCTIACTAIATAAVMPAVAISAGVIRGCRPVQPLQERQQHQYPRLCSTRGIVR
jgi:hypothetical protein